MKGEKKQMDWKGRGIVALCALCAAVFLLATVPCAVNAHPPGDVTLTYDPTAQTLTAAIVHKTSSPNSHYVKKVEIRINGKLVGAYTYQQQPDSAEFSYTYQIPASTGDTIEFTASCNRFGSKKATLIVQQQPAK